MKTILTLDRANQPFGFPQLNGYGYFDSITSTTISATTYLNLPTDFNTFVTGFNYNNANTLILTQNSGSPFSATINIFTGLTVNGVLSTNTISATTYLNLPPFSGGSVNGLTANTISAATYLNLPTDIRVTGATYNNNTFTFRNNTGGTFGVLFNTVTGLTVNGDLRVTGNTRVEDMTGRTAIFSAASQNVVTIIGSGNSSSCPIFSIVGSQGELFSVNDSLNGSLFSVNDISGLPVLEAFSDDTILMGSYYAPSLNTTKKVTLTAGTNTIYSIPTSAYTGAFFEYTLISTGSTGARAGSIMSIWSGTTAQFTEVTTNDIGTTTGVTFSVGVSGNNAVLTSSATTTGWILKTIIRSI